MLSSCKKKNPLKSWNGGIPNLAKKELSLFGIPSLEVLKGVFFFFLRELSIEDFVLSSFDDTGDGKMGRAVFFLQIINCVLQSSLLLLVGRMMANPNEHLEANIVDKNIFGIQCALVHSSFGDFFVGATWVSDAIEDFPSVLVIGGGGMRRRIRGDLLGSSKELPEFSEIAVSFVQHVNFARDLSFFFDGIGEDTGLIPLDVFRVLAVELIDFETSVQDESVGAVEGFGREFDFFHFAILGGGPKNTK